MKKLKLNLAVSAAFSLCMTVSGDVIYEYNSTATFTSIANVSSTDLANGIETERNWTGGNFDSALTTDGAIDVADYGNNPGNTSASVRYKIDLGASRYITTVNSYSGGRSPRGNQYYELYGSTTDTTTNWDETDTGVWILIGSIQTPTAEYQKYCATSITEIDNSYRELMWVSYPISAANEHTVWKEFDVIPEPTTLGLFASVGALLLVFRRRFKL